MARSPSHWHTMLAGLICVYACSYGTWAGPERVLPPEQLYCTSSKIAIRSRKCGKHLSGLGVVSSLMPRKDLTSVLITSIKILGRKQSTHSKLRTTPIALRTTPTCTAAKNKGLAGEFQLQIYQPKIQSQSTDNPHKYAQLVLPCSFPLGSLLDAGTRSCDRHKVM